MHSMTGFGVGKCEVEPNREVHVEIRTVNSRFLDLKIRLPWQSAALTHQVTKVVRQKVARGRVDIVAFDQRKRDRILDLQPDHKLARKVASMIHHLSQEMGCDLVTTAHLIGPVSGLFPAYDDEEIERAGKENVPDWRALEPAFSSALAETWKMRENEGSALTIDLKAHSATLRDLVGEIERIRGAEPNRLLQRARERLDDLMAAYRGLTPGERLLSADADRVCQEVAIVIDRGDISEELCRIASHLTLLGDVLSGRLEGSLRGDRRPGAEGKEGKSGETDRPVSKGPLPCGRRIEFIVQELSREINTIGAKASTADISALVVDAKICLERLREQVQNVE